MQGPLSYASPWDWDFRWSRVQVSADVDPYQARISLEAMRDRISTSVCQWRETRWRLTDRSSWNARDKSTMSRRRVTSEASRINLVLTRRATARRTDVTKTNLRNYTSVSNVACQSTELHEPVRHRYAFNCSNAAVSTPFVSADDRTAVHPSRRVVMISKQSAAAAFSTPAHDRRFWTARVVGRVSTDRAKRKRKSSGLIRERARVGNKLLDCFAREQFFFFQTAFF